MLLNNQWITEEIKEEIRKYLAANDNEDTTLQNLWDAGKSCSKRKVYSNTNLPQEMRTFSNKQPNLIPKATRERKTDKT